MESFYTASYIFSLIYVRDREVSIIFITLILYFIYQFERRTYLMTTEYMKLMM